MAIVYVSLSVNIFFLLKHLLKYSLSNSIRILPNHASWLTQVYKQFFSFHFIFLQCLSCVCELGCSVHGIRSLILFAYSKSFTMTIEIPTVILFSFILKFNGIFPDFSGNEISSNSFSSTISVINILLHNYFHFAVNFTCFHSIQRTMPFQLNWIQFNEFRSQFRFVVIFYSHDDKYVFCQCDKFIHWFELWLTGKWEHGTNNNFLTAN